MAHLKKMEVNLNGGLKLKKKLEINFKEGEKIKVSHLGDVIGFDGRGFKIDGDFLISEILKTDLHIPLDINHRFDEAVGWFDKGSFEVREDGIYGLLELNPKGKELVENKSYRYLSPVYIMGDGGVVVGLDSVGLVNRPNLLNKELNEKELNEKTKKEKKMEELEKLKTEIDAVKTQMSELKAGVDAGNKTVMDELAVIGGALKEMNKKMTLVAGKTNLDANDKKVELSANDKKVADLLGISHDDFLKTREGNK